MQNGSWWKGRGIYLQQSSKHRKEKSPVLLHPRQDLFHSITMSLLNTLAVLATLLPSIHAAAPSISGYSMTWTEDFIGSAYSSPNTDQWIIDTGTSYPGGPWNWGTGKSSLFPFSTQ